jgi:hypothetical protein
MLVQMNRVVTKSRCALLALAGVLVLATSCATSPKTAHGPKFYEENSANLVIRYSSDQAIFRLKPDGHDGPFYHIFTRQQLCEEDAVRVGKRDLAVVLIGYQWTPELDRQVKQGWVNTLTKLNYRRVVILRSGDSDQVNGLRVEEDRQIAQVPAPSHGIGLVSAAPSQVAAR